MKDVDKFYVRLVYFTVNSYILWPFGIFCRHFNIVIPFWYIVPRKIWQPWAEGINYEHLLCLHNKMDRSYLIEYVDKNAGFTFTFGRAQLMHLIKSQLGI
jgi:hypothetical protein